MNPHLQGTIPGGVSMVPHPTPVGIQSPPAPVGGAITELGPSEMFDDLNSNFGRVKRKLSWFYRRFNSAKLGVVDRIVHERGGVEGSISMFQELGSRYPGGEVYLFQYDALEEFYTTFNPAKSNLVGAVMEEWNGKEERLMKTLEKKFGTSFFRERGLLPPTSASPLTTAEVMAEEYVRGVYGQCCPEMLPFVPTLTQIYRGRLSELTNAVSIKFGVPGPAVPSTGLEAPPHPQQQQHQQQQQQQQQQNNGVEEIQQLMDEKDTLIKAQMHLIEDYALQLDQRREEANAHEQTVHYLRHLHTRAHGIIEKFGRHLKSDDVQPIDKQQQQVGGELPVSELHKLCGILDIKNPLEGQPQPTVTYQHQQSPGVQIANVSSAYNRHHVSQHSAVAAPFPPQNSQLNAGLNPVFDMTTTSQQTNLNETMLPNISSHLYKPSPSIHDDDESLPPSPVNRCASI